MCDSWNFTAASLTIFWLYSDQTVEKQAEKLKDVSSKYERDKKFWVVTISDLDQKIKV